jgi:hypothetical protein
MCIHNNSIFAIFDHVEMEIQYVSYKMAVKFKGKGTSSNIDYEHCLTPANLPTPLSSRWSLLLSFNLLFFLFRCALPTVPVSRAEIE